MAPETSDSAYARMMKESIRKTFNACDQDKTNQLLVLAAVTGLGILAKEWMNQFLSEAEHDVQVYWNGDCDIPGCPHGTRPESLN